MLNKQRAKEIVNSPDMKDVTFQGKPIFIQNVDENNSSARVYYLDDPTNEFNVQLSQLQEK